MRAVVYQSFFGSRNLSKFLRFGFSGTAKIKPEIIQNAAIAKSIIQYHLNRHQFVFQHQLYNLIL